MSVLHFVKEPVQSADVPHEQTALIHFGKGLLALQAAAELHLH